MWPLINTPFHQFLFSGLVGWKQPPKKGQRLSTDWVGTWSSRKVIHTEWVADSGRGSQQRVAVLLGLCALFWGLFWSKQASKQNQTITQKGCVILPVVSGRAVGASVHVNLLLGVEKVCLSMYWWLTAVHSCRWQTGAPANLWGFVAVRIRPRLFMEKLFFNTSSKTRKINKIFSRSNNQTKRIKRTT